MACPHFQSGSRACPRRVGNVLLVVDQLVANRLLGIGGAGPSCGNRSITSLDQVKSIEIVEHDHVEGRGGGAFFLITADVEVPVIGSPVGQAVNEPGVAVVREDNWSVCGEERVEVAVAQAVRMFARRLQGHEVHDVDDADLQPRGAAGEFDCGQRFQRGISPQQAITTSGSLATIVAGPFPNAQAGRAVLDGGSMSTIGRPVVCRRR